MKTIIMIPARMAASRLPGKPLALIGGDPMIVQVWRRAMESGVGEVVVACDGQDIADAIIRVQGRVIITDPALPSGSDRIWSALQTVDPSGQYDVVVNLQGDMPTLDPSIVREAVKVLENPQVDIATLAAVIRDEKEKTDPAVVKAILAEGTGTHRAVNFTRASAQGAGPHYHHIGIYAYRRKALERFVALPQSDNEKREKLEQLRAMDNGMRIDVAVVDTVPLGVDTAQTLEKARTYYEKA